MFLRDVRHLFLHPQQGLHLAKEVVEIPQGIRNGGGGGEVHAGALEQGHRVGRASTAEETQIVVHSRFALFQDTLGQGHGRGKAGGILIHIKIIVEVGDTGPLQGDLWIGLNVFAVVKPVEFTVFGAEGVRCQGPALLGLLAAPQLKFRKHSLAVQGGAEPLQEVVDQIGAALGLFGAV